VLGNKVAELGQLGHDGAVLVLFDLLIKGQDQSRQDDDGADDAQRHDGVRPFFRGAEYNDYSYLSDLSADAAPAIIPYMESLGYDFGAYELENPTDIMSEDTQAQWWGSYQPKGFGYY